MGRKRVLLQAYIGSSRLGTREGRSSERIPEVIL
jgi:hypothetical protein